MLIDRPTRRLHQKDVRSANVFEQLKMNLAVGESLQPGLAQRHTDELADLLAQLRVGGSAENLDALALAQLAGTLSFGGRPDLPGLRCLTLAARSGRYGRRLGALFRILSLP